MWHLNGHQVVVIHFLHQPVLDLPMLLMFRILRRRIVLIAHDPVPVLSHQRGAAYLASIRVPQVVVAHGPAAVRDLERAGVPRERLVEVAFGDFVPTIKLSMDEATETLGLSNVTHPVALIVGNLKPGKGIARARQALARGNGLVGTLIVAGQRQGDWDLVSAIPAWKSRRSRHHPCRPTYD